MTETEKIADVVVAAVRAATLPLLERIAVLVARYERGEVIRPEDDATIEVVSIATLVGTAELR